MDLFDPSKTMSFGQKHYDVIINDFSRVTWTLFLVHNNDVFTSFKKLVKTCQTLKKLSILVQVRVIMRKKFQNDQFNSFFEKHEIRHNFFALRIP